MADRAEFGMDELGATWSDADQLHDDFLVLGAIKMRFTRRMQHE